MAELLPDHDGIRVEMRAKCPKCVTGYLVKIGHDIACDVCSSYWRLDV